MLLKIKQLSIEEMGQACRSPGLSGDSPPAAQDMSLPGRTACKLHTWLSDWKCVPRAGDLQESESRSALIGLSKTSETVLGGTFVLNILQTPPQPQAPSPSTG